MRWGAAAVLAAGALTGAGIAQQRVVDETKPLPVSEPRPSAATVEAWQARRFGMFIHFGLYSELGGVWQGKNIDNGYSEQIMANAPIPRDEYAALAKSFDPEKFDADAIVALAKAAGMRFIVVTSKHHDGFAMFGTKQTDYNIVEATPYRKDVVKELADACKRGGLKFGVYYSTIDWHAPTGSAYIEGNSNPTLGRACGVQRGAAKGAADGVRTAERDLVRHGQADARAEQAVCADGAPAAAGDDGVGAGVQLRGRFYGDG